MLCYYFYCCGDGFESEDGPGIVPFCYSIEIEAYRYHLHNLKYCGYLPPPSNLIVSVNFYDGVPMLF